MRLPEQESGDAAREVAPPPSASPTTEAVRAAGSASNETRFPIVGVGASAGGLEAFEGFLRHVPKKSGMAFVFIQHLDPKQNGMLVELLQRATPMPVVQAGEGMKVEPNHVYVIPHNRDLSLLHGTLHLLPQLAPRGLNLPIDFFFRSLAEDQQERAVGVILSGMGSDGVLGLRAIKERSGAAFVQSLNSAKFEGMPRSAVDAGLADVVAPVEDLPGRILAYRKRYFVHADEVAAAEDHTQTAIERVCVLLRAHTGNDFSLYKRSTIQRRIERRMGLHQINTVSGYVRYLRETPKELDQLFRELLIGVTSFFRDAPTWEHLRNEVLPALISHRASGGVLRAWVPGCSTGEEALSLAITFREALEPFKHVKNVALQIFATDIDREAIEKARKGTYPANIVADVSPERLERWFVQDERGYHPAKEIREMVVFAPQNVISDPPFTKLDIIACRNLLIYLSPELQKRLIPVFHYSLNRGGVLFLGTAETVGNFTNLFTPLDGTARIYRRLDHSLVRLPVEFASSVGSAIDALPEPSVTRGEKPRATQPNIEALADRYLAQHFAPVGVLCTEKGEILYTSGRTGSYLEPAIGKASLNIFSMAREGLRRDLSTAFSAALRSTEPIVVRGVKMPSPTGDHILDLTVQRVSQPKELSGAVVVVFAKVAPPHAAANRRREAQVKEPTRVAALQHELHLAHEDAQTTREEMQTSQEELKSANEELQSTNEELQSTNEELTTSKEELQSLNEELQTLNHELQSKLDDLSRSNNDMKNLLNSTDIATLFLDGELHVRRFTTQTTKIIKLIPSDVGRPITDIATDLEYSNLAEDAREVLRTLTSRERQAKTHDGRWYSVRVLPYRTMDNVIDGVVLTFTDASVSRALESALREQASQVRQILESLPNLVWRSRADGAFDYLGPQWVAYTGVPEEEQLGHRWLDQVSIQDRESVRESWRSALKHGTPFACEFRLQGIDGARRWFKARAVPIRDTAGVILHWLGTAMDVDDMKTDSRAGPTA